MTREDTLERLKEARITSTRYPWERQHNEGRKAFEAFCIYRDLGPTRSGEEVARQLTKSAQLIRRWSAKWKWVKRVNEWGDEQDRINRIAQTEAIRKMNERHSNMAMVLQSKVVTVINTLSAKTPKGAKALAKFEHALTPTVISRLLEVGVKIERQARGEAGDVVEEKEEPISHLAHFTTEELEQLDRIHSDATERAGRDTD